MSTLESSKGTNAEVYRNSTERYHNRHDRSKSISLYSIDLKIVAFPCERDFHFFEIIRLVIFVEPFNSSQKARIHTFSSSKS